jgi:predicted ATPase
MGQWRYSLTTDRLTVPLQIAQRLYSLAQEQDKPSLMVGACTAMAQTLYFMGDFETARRHAVDGVQIWRSVGAQSPVEDIDAPIVTCLVYAALSEWHSGGIASCHATIAESILLAKELNDMYVLANAIFDSAVLAYFERNVSEVERLASEVIELSTRHNFAFWLAIGSIMRGWARSASGDTAEGISWIEEGIREYRAPGSMLGMPFYLAVKAEAFYLADRASEALHAIEEAEALSERFEVRWWCAELRRFRGVFLAAIGADETQIEASFRAAISTARQQKSISLAIRAEASYAEYRDRKGER